MNIFRILFALVVCFSIPQARAQQFGTEMVLQPIPCVGAANVAGGNQIFLLENYVNGILPPQVHIVSSLLWMEGASSTVQGNVIVWIDPGRDYVTRGGYPKTQMTTPNWMNKLNVYEAFPGGTKKSETVFNPPLVYNSGVDIMAASPECVIGGSIPEPILIISTQENLQALPLPPQVSVTFDSVPATPNSTFTARNAFPAFSGTPSQCRAHITSSLGQGAPTTLSHVSICQQNAATSSCQAPPIEMKFGLQSGSAYSGGAYTVPAIVSVWTDWTAFSPAGQPILVTATDISGWFSYKASGSYGAWASTNAADWNSISLTGPVFANPGQTYIIDKVQCQ